MNAEQAYFLEIVKSAITGKKLTEKSLDNKTLLLISRGQKLDVLTYYALKNNNINKSVVSSLQKNVFDKFVKTELFKSDIKNFLSALEKGGIKCVTLKGNNEQNLYPVPDMREMNDFDCLIDCKDLKKSKKILKNAGFKIYKKTAKHIEFHSQNGFLFELHIDLFERFLPKSFVKEVLSSGRGIFAPTPEQEYIICQAHLASHYISGGVGLRGLIDLYLLDKTDFDKEHVYNTLAKFKLDKFNEKILYLTKIIFENAQCDEYYSNLIEQTFSSYALGSLDKKELYELALSYKGDYSKAKGKKFFKKLYPTFSDMKGNYPSLQKFPFLLPLYYFIRHVKLIFSRRKNKTKRVYTEREVKNAYELLNSLGLGD